MADAITSRAVPNAAQRELARARGLERKRLAAAVGSPLPEINRRTELVERTRPSSGSGRHGDPDDDGTLYRDQGVGGDENVETAGSGGIRGGIAPAGNDVKGTANESPGEAPKANGGTEAPAEGQPAQDEPDRVLRKTAEAGLKVAEHIPEIGTVVKAGEKIAAVAGVDVAGEIAKKTKWTPWGIVIRAFAGDKMCQFIVFMSLMGMMVGVMLAFELLIGAVRQAACFGVTGFAIQFTEYKDFCDSTDTNTDNTNVNSGGQVK